jgi:pimeloyl-ACP methyl ester carboxylesterase
MTGKINKFDLGGYIAARYAELYPNHVKKLFLLCPAFGLAARWREFLSADDLTSWKSSGSYSYDGRQLHYAFFDDITQNHPAYPQVSCLTSIVHGKVDRIVPVEASRTFINEQKDKSLIKLVEVDDDHYLTKSLQQIIPIVSQFLLSESNK